MTKNVSIHLLELMLRETFLKQMPAWLMSAMGLLRLPPIQLRGIQRQIRL